jgi:rare lipoprotein A
MTICDALAHKVLAGCLAGLILVGCSTSPRFATRNSPASPRGESGSESPKSGDSKFPRNPSGKILLTLEGIASYYADDFHGKQTSNGEVYDMNDLTAAHRTFPFGTKVRITNLDNGKTVVVRVNDRGPFHEGRIIDLSLGAAKELDLIKLGTARVRLEVLEWGDGTSP